MRTAVTLGIHRGGEIVELLAAFPTAVDEQRRAFKELRREGTHDRFERIELWESGAGRVVQHRFRDPARLAPSGPAVVPEPAVVQPTPAPAPAPAGPPDPAPLPPAVDQGEAGEEGEFEIRGRKNRPARRG
ncbi:MAG: hypothetical protein ACKO3N_02015 [Verrucomicrobiota bacterium]